MNIYSEPTVGKIILLLNRMSKQYVHFISDLLALLSCLFSAGLTQQLVLSWRVGRREGKDRGRERVGHHRVAAHFTMFHHHGCSLTAATTAFVVAEADSGHMSIVKTAAA